MGKVIPFPDEKLRLRMALEDAAVSRAQRRARFLFATPDRLPQSEWLRIVNEYHAALRAWELAEDEYISYLRSHP